MSITIFKDSKISLLIDGTNVEYTWEKFASQLTKYSCVDGLLECSTDIASINSLNIFFLLFSATLVFIMQAGFTLLEVGSVHVKNTKNILTKNVGDAMIGAISFYLFGYAFGPEKGDTFIGHTSFALTGESFYDTDGIGFNGYNYVFWLFQWAFAATAATIVSGAVAERVTFEAYFVYSFFLTAFIYPVVAHWGWSTTGWASAFKEKDLLFGHGVIDFAGSGVVHMTGGLAALVGAYLLGPRTGRFDGNGKPVEKSQQSVPFQTLGTFILWFGWYGFNCGSMLALEGNAASVVAKTAVTTTISAATSGLSTVIWGKLTSPGYICPSLANNGILAGLVGITASCSVVEPEAAIVIGFISSIIYFTSSKLLLRFQIDDVVDAAPVHFFCGIWGVLAAGLFATQENHLLAYGLDEDSSSLPNTTCGIFYKCNGNSGSQLGAQIVFILAIIAWVGATSFIMFYSLKHFGILRVTAEVEKIGLDESEHGGHAYGDKILSTTAVSGTAFPEVDYKSQNV